MENFFTLPMSIKKEYFNNKQFKLIYFLHFLTRNNTTIAKLFLKCENFLAIAKNKYTTTTLYLIENTTMPLRKI